MTKVIGHRGARGLAAENTIAALEKALSAHVDEVEIDVRVSKDSVPVVVHDPFIRTTAGTKMMIAETNYEQLRRTKPDVLTLDEALRYVNKRMPVMIEVKPKVPTEPVVAVLQKLLHETWQPLDFTLGSKSQRTLVALHNALPAIKKVVIERFSSVRAVWRARKVQTHRLAMNQHFIWFGFVMAMHRRGYELYAYTLNDPVKAKRWQQRGLGGIITDHPEYFTDFLGKS